MALASPLTQKPRHAILANLQSFIAKLLVVTSLTISIGGHWGFLQTIAWSSMLLDYSENLNWTSALSKTIDPDTSCRICEFVQEGKQQESNRNYLKTQFKIDLVFEQREIILNCPDIAADKFTPVALQSQFHSPPIPPPPLLLQG